MSHVWVYFCLPSRILSFSSSLSPPSFFFFFKSRDKSYRKPRLSDFKACAKPLTFDSVSPPLLSPHSHLACLGTSLREITISGRINEARFLLNVLPPTQYGYVAWGWQCTLTPLLSCLLGGGRGPEMVEESVFTRQNSWTF